MVPVLFESINRPYPNFPPKPGTITYISGPDQPFEPPTSTSSCVKIHPYLIVVFNTKQRVLLIGCVRIAHANTIVQNSDIVRFILYYRITPRIRRARE